ncbi:MAG: type II toxin-antitoxin system RelE/ParE family toxin [Treponema sp.]|jgi:plasmid stabilization system protein ParE|nr:type II toxin-antitoxin system RelE/ParE family toxin [Treponema sp.]
MRKISWTQDGIDSINEIIDYYREHYGDNVAENIYRKIIKEVDYLEIEEMRTKLAQELKDIGILDVYEIIVSPWKIYYKISEDNKKAFILFVLDGRRNIEEILISKVINNKI